MVAEESTGQRLPFESYSRRPLEDFISILKNWSLLHEKSKTQTCSNPCLLMLI